MSRSSSPLHSSRSHGLQPPTTPSSLEHAQHLSTHPRYPSCTNSCTGGAFSTDQSIYLVAAPNPHHYLVDDPLGTASSTAFYGGLPPGGVSPHSLTDKSIGGISDGRGGFGGSIGSGARIMPSGVTTLGYQPASRMISSFYSPPLPELNAGANSTLGLPMQNSRLIID